ncbi:macro domain-containing protein [Candidatus Woesearchaeota archaeon]|nr:macro domain-containing protein [Candidatus Woesearchaeota archaeon]
MKVTVKQGDITESDADAIVNAANSYGYMGGGVAGAIKRKGGKEIEMEAVSKAPIPVGSAVMTTAGTLRCRHVIHAPTMEQPASRIDVGNVRKSVRAALECAENNKLKRIAMPAMGTGVGRVPFGKAAEAMIKEISGFKGKSLEEVILTDRNKDMVDEFRKALGK